jgi:hypothetical protein
VSAEPLAAAALSVPEIEPDADALSAALTYAKTGWYVGPCARATKHPGSVLGSRWQDQTSRDPQQIVAWFAGTDHGVFLHVGRSGAVVLDVDRPERLPLPWREALINTPLQLTREADIARGHYVCAMPTGVTIGNPNLPDGAGEVRGTNGVIIVAPSVHEKATEGGCYRWARTGIVTMLPDLIAAELPRLGGPSGDAASDAVLNRFLAECVGATSPDLLRAPLARFTERASVGSRHSAAVEAAAWIAREAAAGLYPARHGFSELGRVFGASFAPDERRRGRGGSGELTGVIAWAVGQLSAASVAEQGERVEKLINTTTLTSWANGVVIAEPTIDTVEESTSRRVDLGPFLDGTHVAPVPTLGGRREDGVVLLYPGKWHTTIGPTGSGKSWFALWHVAGVLADLGTVVYCHFEEAGPAGTVSRLADDLCVDRGVIAERFVWLECDRAWSKGEFAAELAALPVAPHLVVLDGINAACSQHAWPTDKPEGVGAYRGQFVTPAARLGAAVLSLGHPPKARDRQTERHGFGSTAWLDEVDGAGFRLEPTLEPVGKGKRGHAHLSVVKDRPGSVQEQGRLSRSKEGWTFLGDFWLDNGGGVDVQTGRRLTTAWLTAPRDDRDDEGGRDSIDALADSILGYLTGVEGQRFSTVRALHEGLRAGGVKFARDDVAPALLRLATRGELEWPEVEGDRKPRPGWLRATEQGAT